MPTSISSRRGAVRVTLFSSNGREVSFIDLAGGANFGELAALDGQPRSANVIALRETHLIIMPPQVFRRMLAAHPAVAEALLRQLTAIIRRLCERIFEYATSGVHARIHAELLRLARAHLDLDGVARIPRPPTHAHLASRVSCHREAVSRELKSLQNAGLITREKGRLVVPNLQRLQDLANSTGAEK